MRSLPSSERRVQRVRHEVRRREVEVVEVEPVGANFAAITFAHPSLVDFVSEAFDDHLKFIFESPAGETVMRDYTPRRFDRAGRTLTIEFALHGHGLASDWARQAAIGQRATIGGPRGSMIVPADYHWHLLAGDATALPAIHRRLEELPAATRAIVIAQVADLADRRALASAARLELRWVSTADELVEAVRELVLPQGEGFAWCAGEAATMARLREVLLVDKRHPREAARIAAYWKRGASDFHERLDA
ncbi:siderophore-interacting protein [Rivibacter subsaxonicus]|uniref:NADPH-dependent ferric siderophore reductase n=1 Tax=Rivibacter subsaxonicus TaxID=457575 RepID=A0A4Q7VG03_9BURK|nr:siderophore-interacting protein [Rivibacter subsaxonicus]RZT94936.1 NADPH-dependent ferric siderophore reductase [Rivibacter subsaxonicus]